jgi:hypothetical protein
MKLTWFGGKTLRIHIGGQILVFDADEAPSGIDRAELVSSADLVRKLGDASPTLPAGWQPRRAATVLEDDAQAELAIFRAGEALVIEAPGEPVLVLAGGADVPAGRWGRDAVALALVASSASALLESLSPRLLALAADDATVERVLAEIGPKLDGTGFAALEPGLALEV